MAQTDFSQNAGGGSANAFGQANWANARSGTGGTVNYSDDAYTLRSDLSSFFIQRPFFVFDTSTLPDDATVTAAELRVYRDDAIDTFVNTDTCTMHIVPQAQTDPLELGTAGDYTSITNTSKGSLLFSGTSNGAYAAITLTDLTQVNITGYTKLALITDRDLNNTVPTGGNQIAFQAFGGSNPPVLRVTYTTPSGGGAFIQNFI